jgi:GGDEF domain-containing protein
MSSKTDKGKTPVLSTIIAALCVMFYLGGLGYGVLNIYNSIMERRTLADREIDKLADLVSSVGTLGFMDEPFILAVQDSIDRSQTILGAVITSSRGEFAFERERGTVISWVNDSPRFQPRFAVTNPPKYLPLRIEGQRNVNLQAVAGYLDYDFCIGILKRTLLVILFSLSLAFFTLLMDALLVKNRVAPQAKTEASPPKPKKNAAPVPAARAEEAEEQEPETEDSDGQIPDDRMPSGDAPDNVPDDGLNDDEEIPDFNFDPEEEEASEELPGTGTPAEEALADGTPRGLFSPRGLGWETYTRDRLDSELRRCASTEQDLALIIIDVTNPKKLGADEFKLFCQDAAQYFEHRDLIFEYGDQGISVICPGLSLDRAFAKSEEFNNRVIGKLARPAGSKIDLRFGISSRSGRLIDAGQISREAGEALKRAAGDMESHIVAFKSDPEKYRQYLSRNEGRAPRTT